MASASSEDVVMTEGPNTPAAHPAKDLVATPMSGTELKKFKARERAMINKFEAVSEAIVNKLEGTDPGVVLELFYNSGTPSAELDKAFQYSQLLKLRSDQPFTLMGMVNMGQCNHSGLVAVIVKQTLPFEFLKLPKHVRERIYAHILQDESKTVRVKTRGGAHKTSFAPNYSAPRRLAVLSLNRQIRDESLPILFNQKFVMETTYSMQNFLLQINTGRKYITKIVVEMYERKTAQPAFQLLIGCKALKQLRFDHVSSNSQVPQALKVLWADAGAWLTSFNNPGPHRKDMEAVFHILSFGTSSFHSKVVDKKTGDVTVKKWGATEFGLLINQLKKKLVEANRKSDMQIVRA